MIKLTLIQRCNIHDLEHCRKGKLKVAFAGIDALDRPVIEVVDTKPVPTLIAWSPDGPGHQPQLPLRDFTDSEMEQLDPEDAELLFGLKWKLSEYVLPTDPTEGEQHAA